MKATEQYCPVVLLLILYCVFPLMYALTCFPRLHHLVLHGCSSQGYCLQIKRRSVGRVLHVSRQSSLQTYNRHLKT